jgi:tetratricopeptide (TPR) repeat protein
MYQMGLGHWEKSLELGRLALERLEEIGNVQEAEVARTIIANTLHFCARFDQSEEWARRLLESAEQRRNPQHLGWGLFLTGRALLFKGRRTEALDLIDRGYECLGRVPDNVSFIMSEGLLAKALFECGNESRALEIAERLRVRRAEDRLVPLAQCLDGYGSLGDVYLGLAERGPSPDLINKAAAACRDLHRFAGMFPMASPTARRLDGRLQWMRGHRRQARKLWLRSAREAEKLGRPYEEALAHDILGRHGGDAAEDHRRRACEILHHLGCTLDYPAAMQTS